MSNYEYYVDLVLAIDGTGSMGRVIEGVKSFAGNMHEQVQKAMEDIDKRIDGLRVKVIVFRDFVQDSPTDALSILEFRKVPEQAGEISAFVNAIAAKGGGDNPENALEALALAINSDWVQEGTKQRHVIMLFTDFAPHEYMTKTGSVALPDLPPTLDDLMDQWAGTGQSYGSKLGAGARRMFLFVPDVPEWNSWEGQDLVGLVPIGSVQEDPEGTRSEIIRLIQESVSKEAPAASN